MATKTNYPNFLAIELWGDPHKLQGDLDHLNETAKILREAKKALKRQDAQTYQFLLQRLASRTMNLSRVTDTVMHKANESYRIIQQREAFER